MDFDKDVAKFSPRQLAAIDVMDKGGVKYMLYGGAVGGGKILSDDGVILTPFGWRLGKDLRVGDLVCHPSGSMQKIVQIKPRVTLEKWIVEFSDGTKTEVAADHLWAAWKAGKSRKISNERTFGEGSAEVVETQELKVWLERGYRPQIPVTKPVAFNRTTKEVDRIDPYLLGVLLGDGCITNDHPAITCHEDEKEHFQRYFVGNDIVYTTEGAIRFIGATRLWLLEKLKLHKLYGTRSNNKFVPAVYLWGSIETRQAVLQGLMDTDGWSAKSKNAVYFDSVSKQLAEDVAFLVRSLGGTATINQHSSSYKDILGEKVKCQDSYTVYIRHPDPNSLFRMERKQHGLFGKNLVQKSVVAVYPEGEITGRCITVSNPDGLYITNDFIVTHNSYFLRWFCVRRLLDFAARGLRWVTVMLACEDYPALKDRQLQKIAREFPPWLGKLHQDHKEYGKCYILEPRFGNGVICFRNLDDPSKYASSEFAMICVDELTKNDYELFTHLRTRLRWPGLHDMDCWMVGATNPGGVGHAWCKQLWMDKAFPHEFREPVDYTKAFAYVPSKADDNPHLDASYWAMLSTLPEQIRKAFRDGDWDIFLGQAFVYQKQRHVIPQHEIPETATLYMTFDWGFGAPFSIGWWYVDKEGRVIRFDEWYGWNGQPNQGLRLTDPQIAQGIVEREKELGIWGKNILRYAGPDCFAKKPDYKGGGQGPSTAEVFGDYGIYLSPGDADRRLKIRAFRERMALPEDKSLRPMLQVTSNCKQFQRIIPTLVLDTRNIEDIDQKQEDHLYDEVCHICMGRPLKEEKIREITLTEQQEDWKRIHGEQLEVGRAVNMEGE